MSWFPSYTALLVEIEIDKNCRENSSLVSFSKTIAPPLILRKCLINQIICGVPNSPTRLLQSSICIHCQYCFLEGPEDKKMSFCFCSFLSDPLSDNKRSNSHKNNLRYRKQNVKGDIFNL